MDWPKTTARRDGKHLSFGVWYVLYQRIYGSSSVQEGPRYGRPQSLWNDSTIMVAPCWFVRRVDGHKKPVTSFVASQGGGGGGGGGLNGKEISWVMGSEILCCNHPHIINHPGAEAISIFMLCVSTMALRWQCGGGCPRRIRRMGPGAIFPFRPVVAVWRQLASTLLKYRSRYIDIKNTPIAL